MYGILYKEFLCDFWLFCKHRPAPLEQLVALWVRDVGACAELYHFSNCKIKTYVRKMMQIKLVQG